LRENIDGSLRPQELGGWTRWRLKIHVNFGYILHPSLLTVVYIPQISPTQLFPCCERPSMLGMDWNHSFSDFMRLLKYFCGVVVGSYVSTHLATNREHILRDGCGEHHNLLLVRSLHEDFLHLRAHIWRKRKLLQR